MFANPTIDTRIHPFKALKAVGQLLSNPEDTRQVFNIFRAMRGRSGLRAFNRFAASPEGARLLQRRPSLLATLQDRDCLVNLPAGSMGRAYLAFMDEENLSADGLVAASQGWEADPVPAEMDFYRARMRDAHDLTHILTGYGRDPLGEICLLAFMYAHTRNRGMALIVGMSWLKLSGVARQAVAEAWRNGRKAAWFQNQNYEALLARPLEDVRRDLDIVAPTRYAAVVSAAARA